jgi:hypothetical protein
VSLAQGVERGETGTRVVCVWGGGVAPFNSGLVMTVLEQEIGRQSRVSIGEGVKVFAAIADKAAAQNTQRVC